MEQNILREFERRCIQAEPAYCTAECPFHMDVKAFTGHISAQDMESAFKVIEKSIPLPEIISRICDHPCENRCIRKDIDDPVAIGELEKACAKSRSGRKKKFKLPAKGKKVGIWGSGLSSLTAASDLIMKGYDVTISEKASEFGGNLLDIPGSLLPPSIIEMELKSLESFGVRFRAGVPMVEEDFIRDIESFDAVFLGSDSNMERYPLFESTDLFKAVDPFTLQIEDKKIFAGGFPLQPDAASTHGCSIFQAAQGRKAATSIDRFLSKVSMSAGREKEGSCPTRLSTDIGRVEIRPGIRPSAPQNGLSPDEAASEAARCIQCDCSRCIRVCRYIESFKGYPGRYAREIYNNAAIVMGERKANLLINSCSLCDLCETVCPNDFSMADLCLSARAGMVNRGKMPPSAHEFALQEMARASSDELFVARHEPGYEKSERIFFPGCQLAGSSPFQVEKVYRFLIRKFEGATGFVSGCCGAPAKWAGRDDLFAENMKKFKAFWEASGRPLIITACTSCSRMFEKGLEGVEIKSLFEIIAEEIEKPDGSAGMLKFSNSDDTGREEWKNALISEGISVIDPCTARDDDKVQRAVRKIAEASGIKIKELEASGNLTECCGFGGVVYNANPPLAKEIIERRSGQSDNPFLAYCSMCRDRLASTGKKVIHILDLLWPSSENPAERKDPGFSIRHDNLVTARENMLSSFWKEESDTEVESRMEIVLSAEVRQSMEERFILKEDIMRVLKSYESGSNYFINAESGNLIAFHRPKRVCFWVEFRMSGASCIIEDIWSHRMEVVSNNRFEPGPPAYPLEDSIICGGCSQAVEHYKSNAKYLEGSFDVVLPQCSRCGSIFVSKQLADGKMAEVERILEDK